MTDSETETDPRDANDMEVDSTAYNFIVDSASQRENTEITENDVMVSSQADSPPAGSSRGQSDAEYEQPLPLYVSPSTPNNQDALPKVLDNLSSKKGDTPSKKRVLSDDDEDDGKLCPICYDNWTNSGKHRISLLKCGHLFGYKCIEQWFNSQVGVFTCPTCMSKSNGISDIRFIYVKKLIAVDTIELEAMRDKMEKTKRLNNALQMNLNNYAMKYDMLKREMEDLKKQMVVSQSSQSTEYGFNLNQYVVKLYKDKTVEMARNSSCRVFDVSSELNAIIISTRSPYGLFCNFGIRKVHMSTFEPLSFIPLHSMQIRDLSIHAENGTLITASMDKCFKIISFTTNTVMHTVKLDTPLWSCCWDASNKNILYVGGQSGEVFKYDTRCLSKAVTSMTIVGDTSPVVSIASLPFSPELGTHNSVLACKLNSLWLFENTPIEYKQHPLAIDGPFISMKYQQNTGHMLVSSRPNNRVKHSRHTVCSLAKNDDEFSCNVLQTFHGGGMQKLMSKSCFVADKEDYVAAYQESSERVYLWSINTGKKVCSVFAHDAVLDLRGMQNHHGNYLLSLTDYKMEFFKFNSQ